MTSSKNRADRRERQAAEIEANQVELRANIAESKRLVEQANKILQRHRKEWGDDADPSESPSQQPGRKGK